MIRRGAAWAWVLVAAAMTTGCGGGQKADRPQSPVVVQGPAVSSAPPAQVPPAAAIAAERYAVAARVWSVDARRAREGYRTQLRLATGGLRVALKRFPLGEGDVEQLRLDGAAAEGRVTSVRPAGAVTRARAELLIEVLERTSRAGVVGEATVRCRVTVKRDGESGAWRVAAFTVVPSDETGAAA